MHQHSNWRTYQTKLRRRSWLSGLWKGLPKVGLWGLVLFLPLYLLWSQSHWIPLASKPRQEPAQKPSAPLAGGKASAPASTPPLLDKISIQGLIGNMPIVNATEKQFSLDYAGQPIQVITSLAPSLQSYILKQIDRKNSRYVGIVAMEPETGKIVCMAGFDKTNHVSNPCLYNQYPAASIFKIVTAAAAVEKLGFHPGSALSYSGRKHTLYRSQLNEKQNRHTNHVSFRDSFAQSINPVFGKIGSLYLGKQALEKYALAFGFNRHIDFEIPYTPSLISIKDKPYHWAEIATGFNRETIISPLHGALIAAAILNQGRLVEPTIVEKMIDSSGHILYECRTNTIQQAIAPKSTEALYDLMLATITSGTARKSFRGYKRDRVLSKLNIGGKTGSINNRAHDLRFDWFVGFAHEKKGPAKLVISVVVAHEEYIGTRATRYARLIFKQHFRGYFANRKPDDTPKS